MRGRCGRRRGDDVLERWVTAASTSMSCATGCKDAMCGRESGLGSGGVGVGQGKAGRSGVVEPKRAERGGGDEQKRRC